MSWRTGLEVSPVGGAVTSLTCNYLSRTAALLLSQTLGVSVPCLVLQRKTWKSRIHCYNGTASFGEIFLQTFQCLSVGAESKGE